ncbi:hypothetical protein, partial [Nostoc sp. DedQUE09]|uniref:hypothetical protein n=1 Tax=Nostoc sp. DedQUE09 TaxID=3075394 RepID=UPI002AD51996
MISAKENTCVGEFRLRSTLDLFSWLSEVETNGIGIFILVNHLTFRIWVLQHDIWVLQHDIWVL